VNLKSEGKISKAVAGFRLSSQNAELYIGDTDHSRIYGDMAYSPVTYQAYWRIALQRITVGTTSVVEASTGYTVIVDTGEYRTCSFANPAD
jgi:hypothetical protein